ncbi:Methyl-accepting chemotaxis protein [Rhodospira trueperi]|uniref:Methyl-accepting chemotaxis protein n=1 Tax=Rhodospira trueperi TaxID=69960 RepID=A0A1G6YSK3_9PROT|nr:HAMP domain-containing methyl-accepting chemotaxis protein [Rhodospira trueperi]SDD93252.1 Methyl-accepting chemotaxis protein [Rhodospira trueperi]
MTLSTRILTGFLFVLLLTMVVAAIGWRSLESSNTAFGIERTGLDAQIGLGKVVQHELQGRLDLSADVEGAVYNEIEKMTGQLSRLLEHDSIRPQVMIARDAVDAYKANFETFKANEREVNATASTVRVVEEDLSATVGEVAAERAERLAKARETATNAIAEQEAAAAMRAVARSVEDAVYAGTLRVEQYRRVNTEARATEAAAAIQRLTNTVQRLGESVSEIDAIGREELSQASEGVIAAFTAFDEIAAQERALEAERHATVATMSEASEALDHAVTRLSRFQTARLKAAQQNFASRDILSELTGQLVTLTDLHNTAARARIQQEVFLRTGDPEDAEAAREATKALFLGALSVRRNAGQGPTASLVGIVSQATQDYRRALERIIELVEELGAAAEAGAAAERELDRTLRTLTDISGRARAAAGAMADQASQAATRSFTTLDTAQDTIRVGSDLRAAAEIVREHIIEFIDERDDSIVPNVREHIAAFKTIREDLIARIGQTDPWNVVELDQTLTHLSDQLEGMFEELVVKTQAINGATRGMEEARQALESGLEDAQAAAEARASDDRMFAKTLLLVGAVLALVVGVVAALLIGRSITRPLRAITATMKRLADNDLTVEVPGRDRKDEVGAMAAAVAVFKENSHRIERMQVDQEAEHRRNARRVKSEMIALTNALDEQVRGAISEVRSQSEVMHDTAVKMAEVVAHTEDGAGAAATASRNSAANVDAVAAAAEQMASSIAEISRQVNGASDIAHRASREAGSANERVEGLAQAANEIGEVVNLISDIAKQTNLLALNATIEAARAGEAGKGFAVVANEVKTLANQTATATDDIARQISTIQTATNAAVEAIQAIVRVIAEINEITTGVSAAVEQQAAATGEISQNAQQAAHSTQDASQNIDEVSRSAETTGGHARDVRESAEAVCVRVVRMLEELEKIIRSGSEEERETHAMRTVNIAVSVDLGGGDARSCLLQDMSFSGLGTLDRSVDGERGHQLMIDIPDLGQTMAVIVARTESNTHIRFDVSDSQLSQLEAFVRQRQR